MLKKNKEVIKNTSQKDINYNVAVFKITTGKTDYDQ